MIGYIYKTTNKITGQFYIGKREYIKDEDSASIYYGSGKALKENIKTYGIKNFMKEILDEANTLEDLVNLETKYIRENIDNPKCLNYGEGVGFGGIYQVGKCPKCGDETVLYSNSGLCMKCIIGNYNKSYCPECDKETCHYKNGKCMKCVSKNAHKVQWCDFCQEETTHCGNECKCHKLYLIKKDGKIALCLRNSHYGERVIFSDVHELLDSLNITQTPRTTIYSFKDGFKKIKCGNSFTGLKAILYNNDVSDWLKITYRYDGRKDHIRSLTVTTDHPLPIISGEVKRADELVIGDKLVRVELKTKPDAKGGCKQWEFGEIISIEKINYNEKSYDVTTDTEYFNVNEDIISHNCRSFLTVYTDPKTKKAKFYGRWNQGVVTLNLVDVACSSKKNMDMFWYILNDRLELCHRALRVRHEHLRGVRSDVAPILWQHGALARLKPGETIDNLLYNGYSTLSLGYAGLYECVKYMTGQSHTDINGGKDFALAVMKALNDACAKWKQVEKIDYSLYGTPMESTTYKFAKGLQKRFGIIKDVTDHNYITNSYHVNVREDINAFDKLKFESDFQALSPGGAISYVEVPNMQNNIPAVLEVIKYIYDTIMYAELNTKLDWCENCGYSGELQIIKDTDGKTIWKCPNCDCGEGKITGNELDDQNLLHPIRRTCGYIGAQKWNDGRTDEIKDRVLHL